jgi:phosphomethylpyrimidine synthase
MSSMPDGRDRPAQGTQLASARAGRVTEQMRRVAQRERLAPEDVRAQVASGRMIIPANVRHPELEPLAIGRAATCKVNANIGTSEVGSSVEGELEKLRACLRFGADTVMDLSTGGDLERTRDAILRHSPLPVGTVPVYECAARLADFRDLEPDLLLEVIEAQAAQGVDFMTIHAGVLRAFLPLAARRVTGIVSRGGALLAEWMQARGEENPFHVHFDRICEILARYDVAVSLGDGLRPGCLADASDEAQFAELEVLGRLTRRARDLGVQAMVEGPGHVPLNQISMNVEREREVCDDAPFYVLGPLVTDVAPGYDHITSAIGAAVAAYHGAAMLCYVTPSEHLGLPTLEDVRQGIIAYRIAAHAADVALERPGARDRDDELSRARYAFDWERQFALALDPEAARRKRAESPGAQGIEDAGYCSMCGPRFCAMRIHGSLARPEECPGPREARSAEPALRP